MHLIEKKISNLKEFKSLDISSIKEVQHGTINRNFVISDHEKSFFLRLNNPSVAGVNRGLEAGILEQLKPLKITPKVIANNISDGYLILEYLEVNHWDHKNCLVFQDQLLKQLSKVHQIQLSKQFPSLLSRLVDYERKSNSDTDKGFYSSYYSTKQRLQDLGFFEENKLVHFDLNANNLLGTNPVYIIDWEFAGSAHPIYDLALFVYYNNINLKESPLIIEYSNKYTNGEKILKLAIKLAKDMTKMWEMIETTNSFKNEFY